MTTSMTDAQLAAAAEFYGIDMVEARRRHALIMLHADNPHDPICVGCARRPDEIAIYVEIAGDMGFASPAEYVVRDEGTYNPTNGHFLCDPCYIKNGSPTSSTGWKCP